MISFPTSPVQANITVGLASALLFWVAMTLGLGFVFLFLPTLPLFAYGMHARFRLSLYPAVMGACALAIVSPSAALAYWMALGLPAWLLLRGLRRGASLPQTIAGLCAYACGLLFVSVVAGMSQGVLLNELIATRVRSGFADLPPEYAPTVELLATRFSFLIFVMTAWMWALMLWLHATLASRLLRPRAPTLALPLSLARAALPAWLLGLLGIASFAAVAGSPAMQWLGHACLLMLALPYTLSGLAALHDATRKWPNRVFLLTLTYSACAIFFWPVLCFAAFGLAEQIKRLSGRAD